MVKSFWQIERKGFVVNAVIIHELVPSVVRLGLNYLFGEGDDMSLASINERSDTHSQLKQKFVYLL